MKKLLSLSLSLLALQSAYALDQRDPAACPSVAAIASVGVNKPVLYKDMWAVGAENNYGTPQLWSFYFLTELFDDATAEEALAQANTRISHFADIAGPAFSPNDSAWLCMYSSFDNDHHDLGLAITPPRGVPGEDIRNLYNKFAKTQRR